MLKLLAILLLLQISVGYSQMKSTRTTKDAYVTLLYGGFLSGARVLGQSLKETNTENDLVALCTEAVPETNRRILEADGWIIRSIENIQSPYEGSSYRGDYFSGIFNKLYIWNMTEYDRIFYLDADVIVLSNIDHAFDCGTFCAAYRHSDLFNAGVVVVEPSNAVFNDMIKMIPELPSYDDGDQGFLNVYFEDLKYASMFNWSDSTRQRQLMRMPNGLNADVGLYYMTSRWLIPENELRVIHYTLGPLKPWTWWTYFLFDLSSQWYAIERRLNQYVKHDETFKLQSPIFWAPFALVLALCIFEKFVGGPFRRLIDKKFILRNFVSFNNRLVHFPPLLLLLASYFLGFSIVPSTMHPYRAEYVFWLWSNFFLFLFFGVYCYLCCIVTNRAHKNINPSRKLQSCVLYLLFNLSYIVMKVAPPAINPFGRRVGVFICLLVLHLIVSHIAGKKIILVWSRERVVVDLDESKIAVRKSND